MVFDFNRNSKNSRKSCISLFRSSLYFLSSGYYRHGLVFSIMCRCSVVPGNVVKAQQPIVDRVEHMFLNMISFDLKQATKIIAKHQTGEIIGIIRKYLINVQVETQLLEKRLYDSFPAELIDWVGKATHRYKQHKSTAELRRRKKLEQSTHRSNVAEQNLDFSWSR